MVGTLEPRKRHGQVVDAMEILWGQGVEANLVIVGKLGWNADGLAKRLKAHPESGRRFLWLKDAGDKDLQRAYEQCTVIINASEGEGFGLPLVEAAKHGKPIISRDLPVFREVAGDHAFYFTGDSGETLAETLRCWLASYKQGKAPSSDGIPWLTWKQSARLLAQVVLGGQWHSSWSPPGAAEAARDTGGEVSLVYGAVQGETRGPARASEIAKR